MDKLDSKIIELLQTDGRASNASIARHVGVSEGTVRRRLKRLVDEEYIQVVALPDAAKLGYESQALVGIQVEPDKVDKVADCLYELSEISWVAVTTGSYDVFAWGDAAVGRGAGHLPSHAGRCHSRRTPHGDLRQFGQEAGPRCLCVAQAHGEASHRRGPLAKGGLLSDQRTPGEDRCLGPSTAAT